MNQFPFPNSSIRRDGNRSRMSMPSPQTQASNRTRSISATRRSMSFKQEVPASVPKEPKKKLTAGERLARIRRIQAGDYVRGAGLGLDQFDHSTKAEETKNPCAKNLEKEFSALNTTEKPKFGATQNKERNQQKEPSTFSIHNPVPASVMEKLMKTEENYSALPKHIKQLDAIIVASIVKIKDQARRGILISDKKFAEIFPKERMLELLKKMKTTQKIIQRFQGVEGLKEMDKLLSGPDAAKPQNLVDDDEPQAKSVLHCDVNKRDDVVESIFRLSKILEKLADAPASPRKDCMLSELEKVVDFVNHYEYHLGNLERTVKHSVDLGRKVEAIMPDEEEEDGDDSTGSSSVSSESP